MEIIQERLEREFNIEVIQTAPTVTYEVLLTSGAAQNNPNNSGTTSVAFTRSMIAPSPRNSTLPASEQLWVTAHEAKKAR